MFARIFALMSLSSALLTGCVSLSTPTLDQSWQGRFSISAQSPTARENHSGRFTLSHSGQSLTVLDLKSPLGNTLARITQTPKVVSLDALGSSTVEASDAEALLLKTLGFSVPVQGLQYWLDGNPIPNQEAQTAPSTRPYRQIKQNGWIIQYENYDEAGLPKRIRLERGASETAPAISILLLISARNAS
jgi:outer membrane lipoprotein LolB